MINFICCQKKVVPDFPRGRYDVFWNQSTIENIGNKKKKKKPEKKGWKHNAFPLLCGGGIKKKKKKKNFLWRVLEATEDQDPASCQFVHLVCDINLADPLPLFFFTFHRARNQCLCIKSMTQMA